MPLDLEAIRRRLNAASPAPWTVRRMPNLHERTAGDGNTYPAVRGFRVPANMYDIAHEQVEADATFMAHARQDIPLLLEEVVRLRTALAMARGHVHRCERQMHSLTTALMRIEQPDPDEERINIAPPPIPPVEQPAIRGREDLW